jgi:DNA-binding NarL/FixJ family response regulator
MPIRVLIVDNQTMVRRGLTMFLSTDAELSIVGEATNGHESVRMALEQQPDVILMDLLMPEMDGIDATSMIRLQQPDTHIIALSSSTDYALIITAILAGVDTYMHKGSKPNLLLATIKGITAGRVMLSPNLMERALNDLPTPANVTFPSDQLMLLNLLAAGYSDLEIAQQLHTDPSTIRHAVKAVQARLSSSTRLLTVLRAIQLGLIERPSPL